MKRFTTGRSPFRWAAIVCCLLSVWRVEAQVSETNSTNTSVPTLSPLVSDVPTLSPTLGPSSTHTPTVDPNFTSPECFDNTTVMFQAMLRADPFFPTEYVICPNTRIVVGVNDEDGQCCVGGQLPIYIRARSTVKCGADGSVSNNCTVVGGFSQVYFIGSFFGDAINQDISIQGITFEDAEFVSLAMASRGDVTFTDCIWRKHTRSSGIIFLGYVPVPTFDDDERRSLLEAELDEIEDPLERARFASSRRYLEAMMKEAYEAGQRELAERAAGRERGERKLQSPFEMRTTFEDCLLEDNTQGPVDVGGIPLFGIASQLSPENPTVYRRTVWRRNKFDGSDGSINGFAIQTVGAPLEVHDSCFEDNSFIGFGPVQVFSESEFESSGNFVSDDDLIFCEFAALSDDSAPQDETDVVCVDYELDGCDGSPRTAPPTSSPTSPPSSATSRFPFGSSATLLATGVVTLLAQFLLTHEL